MILTADEARDPRALPSIDPAFSDPERRARIVQLLRAYPDLSETETAEVVTFLHSGKQFDVGMIMGEPSIQSAIEAVRKAHPASFGSLLTHAFWFLVLLFVPLALCCALPSLLGQ
jgi:hypothetical protein